MAVFGPYIVANEVPSPSVDTPRAPRLPNLCMRHFANGSRGHNVYILSDGTATETDPDSNTVFWLKSDGVNAGKPYVTHTFWGAHTPETITSAEATILTNSGFGAFIN